MNGIVTRDFAKDYPKNKYSLLLGGNVVKLNWSDIEPAPGVFNQAEFHKVWEAAIAGPVALRILGGSNSPIWVTYGPHFEHFPYAEGVSRNVYDMPKWWDTEYQHRWEYMLRVVEQNVGDVVDVFYQTGGATVYGEPFIRAPWANVDIYNIIGFNYGLDEEALNTFMDIARNVWRRQSIAVSVFPWQYMENGKPRASLDRTKNIVSAWQPDLIGSNDLRSQPGPQRLGTWEWMSSTNIPVFYQTAQPEKIGDWQSALGYAVQFGAEYVELNRDFTSYDYEDLGAVAYEIGR